LEAVCDYLPSPEDRGDERAENAKSGDKVTVSAEDANFCGLVFKLIAGGSADLLYLRIYSGILKFNDTLVNARTRDKVRVKRILRLYSKSVEALEEAGPGDIVGIIGPSKVVTGDTLCSVNKPLLLEKITFPEPVISIAVEPCSGKDKDKLVSSMEILCREDPTLQTKINENTGQHILSGMGELHLDISTRRIEKEFNIHARFGTPQVAFRETIKAAGEQQGVFEKSLGDNEYFAEVKFKLEPVPKLESGIEVASFIKNTDGIPKAWVESALTALDNGLRTGGNWGYPLIYIKASLLHIGGSPDKTTESAVAGAVLNGLQKAVSAGTVLLEPLMNLEITAPENTIGEITGYLQARRAVIHGIENLPESKRLVCEVPLAEMFGFSKALPKLSGGRAGFSMEPCGYQEISEDNLDKLVARGNSVSFM
jgi:elongation factor G